MTLRSHLAFGLGLVACAAGERAAYAEEVGEAVDVAVERDAAMEWGHAHPEPWMRDVATSRQRRGEKAQSDTSLAKQYSFRSGVVATFSLPLFLGDAPSRGTGTGIGVGFEVGGGPFLASRVPLLFLVGANWDTSSSKSNNGQQTNQLRYWTFMGQTNLLLAHSDTPAYIVLRAGAAALCVKDVGDRYGKVDPSCPDLGVWAFAGGAGFGWDFVAKQQDGGGIGAWTFVARVDAITPNSVFPTTQWIATLQFGGNFRNK